MRYPIMTINEKNKIIVTATIEDSSPEFLSKEVVSGIAVYIEQFSEELNDFAAMSILISTNGNVTLLKNVGFSEYFEKKMLKDIQFLKDEIIDYVKGYNASAESIA